MKRFLSLSLLFSSHIPCGTQLKTVSSRLNPSPLKDIKLEFLVQRRASIREKAEEGKGGKYQFSSFTVCSRAKNVQIEKDILARN